MGKHLPLHVFRPLINVKERVCVCVCGWSSERTVPGYCTLILGSQAIIPADSLLWKPKRLELLPMLSGISTLGATYTSNGKSKYIADNPICIMCMQFTWKDLLFITRQFIITWHSCNDTLPCLIFQYFCPQNVCLFQRQHPGHRLFLDSASLALFQSSSYSTTM